MAGWRPKVYRVLERCGQTHLVGMERVLAGGWLVSLLA